MRSQRRSRKGCRVPTRINGVIRWGGATVDQRREKANRFVNMRVLCCCRIAVVWIVWIWGFSAIITICRLCRCLELLFPVGSRVQQHGRVRCHDCFVLCRYPRQAWRVGSQSANDDFDLDNTMRKESSGSRGEVLLFRRWRSEFHGRWGQAGGETEKGSVVANGTNKTREAGDLY